MLLVRIRPIDKGFKNIQQIATGGIDNNDKDDDQPTNPLLREQQVHADQYIDSYQETSRRDHSENDDHHGVELLDRKGNSEGAFIQIYDEQHLRQQQQENNGFDLLQLEENPLRQTHDDRRENTNEYDDFADLAARTRGPSYYNSDSVTQRQHHHQNGNNKISTMDSAGEDDKIDTL